MPTLPSIFAKCAPRPEVLADGLPDAIFAADLWDVVSGSAHSDYQDPPRFFAGTYPTANLKYLVKEVAERLAGVPERTSVFRLETGFGGGKTHNLIAWGDLYPTAWLEAIRGDPLTEADYQAAGLQPDENPFTKTL